MNTQIQNKKPVAKRIDFKVSARDIWGLLVACGLILLAGLIRYVLFLPRFL